MKALVIDKPWIDKILRGEKTWEMRKRVCNYRGLIALIRKGSGHVVGTARVVDCKPALKSFDDYAAAEQYHGTPPAQQRNSFEEGWRIPWVLAGAGALSRPVPYSHPSGAVVWVNLAPEVAAQVMAQSR
jgi:hypothetical protein